LKFGKRTYQSGVDELTELVSKLPKPKKLNEPYAEADLQVLYWVGRLREFAAIIPDTKPSPDSLDALDAAVGRHGPDAQKSYEEGRVKTRSVRDQIQKQIAEADPGADATMLKTTSRNVDKYVLFPYKQAVQRILSGLDE
jgi:hypothetical protein